MRHLVKFSILFTNILAVSLSAIAQETRSISVDEYRGKMQAGWIGQMAGVGWGAPTEFRWQGNIIPDNEVPEWQAGMINQYEQDDLYVEMTFLRSLEVYGWEVTHKQAGIDFANSGYKLWHANRYGREALRKGIAPPDSGHPRFNGHADDIDYQIEADFSGLIAPGLPNTAIQLGETFGRIMNYGDGLYGGQFVGGMYAAAFFEKNMRAVVDAGLDCIPEKSQYAECIRDVIVWYERSPNDWRKTWDLVNEKYHLNPAYRRFSCSKIEENFNIDAKINGAYIVMGLLYGKGDPDATIAISMQCGQDSDCNPSSAAGVLFTSLGMDNLPEKYVSALKSDQIFSHTAYDFKGLIKVCETLAMDAVIRSGGSVKEGIMTIPVLSPTPSPLEQCWEPGPIAGSRFSEDEMKKIVAKP